LRLPAAARTRPYAIWEVGSGLVLVDAQLAALSFGRPEVQWAIGSVSERLASHLASALKEVRRGPLPKAFCKGARLQLNQAFIDHKITTNCSTSSGSGWTGDWPAH